MTAPPAPIAALLAELAQLGIELRAAGSRLRYRPRSAMTPDLADRLAACRPDLLTFLAAADDAMVSSPAGNRVVYTVDERRLLADCSGATLAAVDATKRAFAPLGAMTVVSVTPFKSAARDDAALLIRNARRVGNDGRAVALRDAWRERLAICAADGDLSITEAEKIAAAELRQMLGHAPIPAGAAECSAVRSGATKGG